VDVITEGTINQDEPVADVVNAVVALKSCQTPILRINDNQSDLQGRLLFSAGGFISWGPNQRHWRKWIWRSTQTLNGAQTATTPS
jgi:hypothetical protein